MMVVVGKRRGRELTGHRLLRGEGWDALCRGETAEEGQCRERMEGSLLEGWKVKGVLLGEGWQSRSAVNEGGAMPLWLKKRQKPPPASKNCNFIPNNFILENIQ